VDQSALTGESLPTTRKSGEAVFSGSIIRRGEIGALVYATGTNTYLVKQLIGGRGAYGQPFSKSRFKDRQLFNYSCGGAGGGNYYCSDLRGDPILTTLQFALVLTVAAIPVAMPTVLSVTWRSARGCWPKNRRL